MAYSLPPPGGPEGGPGLPGLGGLGGLGGGFEGGLGGGFGFPGFGKSFNLDVGGGWGFPGIGGLGGGLPGIGGLGGGYPGYRPYVPITPLGGLWGIKGDLVVPIVAIGVAIFIFILIVLAVKYTIAWKLGVLGELAGAKTPFLRRDAGTAPAEHLEESNLNRLTDIVAAAVYSEGCSRRMLCEVGAYVREGKQYSSLIRLLELVVPQEYHETFTILRDSAEGKFSCEENYPCGNVGKNKQKVQDAENNIAGSTGKSNSQQAPSSSTTNQTMSAAPVVAPPSIETTPAPSVFGKFKRTIFKK